jgi:hypothetical protein
MTKQVEIKKKNRLHYLAISWHKMPEELLMTLRLVGKTISGVNMVFKSYVNRIEIFGDIVETQDRWFHIVQPYITNSFWITFCGDVNELTGILTNSEIIELEYPSSLRRMNFHDEKKWVVLEEQPMTDEYFSMVKSEYPWLHKKLWEH